MPRKNTAAIALGRKGGKKGGPARAAKLTAEQRSESARKAVLARWAKAKPGKKHRATATPKSGKLVSAPRNTSDVALANLLRRLKSTDNIQEIRSLSSQIERVIFHKQFTGA